MTWLVWRQYRTQGAIALAMLVALTAVTLVAGFHVESVWHSIVTGCAGNTTCEQRRPLGDVVGNDVRVLSVIVPAVLGILWGAPLAAHEFESRTSDWAWAQSVTRTRWLAVKAGWLLLAAAVCGGVVAALVTWVSGPGNALSGGVFPQGNNFFETQGIVPIGYTVFAMALGIAAGALFRRTLPAIAVTLGGFIGVRLLFDSIRQYYMTAVTTYTSMTSNFNPNGAWQLASGMVGPNGQQLAQNFNDGAVFNGVPISSLPKACQGLANLSNSGPASQCLAARGYRAYLTYQPASRYWPFQGIETGIFVALAAVLIAITFVIISRRDA
jgi:ABC-type transport system involved in multi-copper enzyme maturation permease subunit